MWLTFWVSILIGVMGALPVLSHPEVNRLWLKVGTIASAGTSAIGKAAEPAFKTEKAVYQGGPIPLAYDRPIQPTLSEAAGAVWWDLIAGIFIDVAAKVASDVIVILIVLTFVGGEEAKKKRREIFGRRGD